MIKLIIFCPLTLKHYIKDYLSNTLPHDGSHLRSVSTTQQCVEAKYYSLSTSLHHPTVVFGWSCPHMSQKKRFYLLITSCFIVVLALSQNLFAPTWGTNKRLLTFLLIKPKSFLFLFYFRSKQGNECPSPWQHFMEKFVDTLTLLNSLVACKWCGSLLLLSVVCLSVQHFVLVNSH